MLILGKGRGRPTITVELQYVKCVDSIVGSFELYGYKKMILRVSQIFSVNKLFIKQTRFVMFICRWR